MLTNYTAETPIMFFLFSKTKSAPAGVSKNEDLCKVTQYWDGGLVNLSFQVGCVKYASPTISFGSPHESKLEACNYAAA